MALDERVERLYRANRNQAFDQELQRQAEEIHQRSAFVNAQRRAMRRYNRAGIAGLLGAGVIQSLGSLADSQQQPNCIPYAPDDPAICDSDIGIVPITVMLMFLSLGIGLVINAGYGMALWRWTMLAGLGGCWLAFGLGHWERWTERHQDVSYDLSSVTETDVTKFMQKEGLFAESYN